MTLPDPGTDPIPEEATYRYPTLARWFGIDVAAQQVADAISGTTPADIAALTEALETLRAADVTVDNIEPGTPGTTPSKKGTKP